LRPSHSFNSLFWVDAVALAKSELERVEVVEQIKEFEFITKYAYQEAQTPTEENRDALHGGKCRHRLQMLGLSYLSNFPGRSSLSCNIRLYGKLRKIYRIGEEVKSDELEWLFRSLEGRISQIKMATKILLDCGIPLPRGLTCSEFDSFSFQTKAIRENEAKWNALTDTLGLSKRGLTPTTVGLPWPKAKIYLEAAIYLLPESEDLKLVERLAAQMEQVSRNAIQTQKMAIEKSPLVSREKRKWYASVRKKLSSLSLSKKRQTMY
jgi:hypothetical protein